MSPQATFSFKNRSDSRGNTVNKGRIKLYLSMRKLLMIELTGLLLFGIYSCKQYNCCGFPVYQYTCIKATDTVNLYLTGKAAYLQSIIPDTLNYYQSNGYIINTVFGPPWQNTCVIGKQQLKQALEAGQLCNPPEVSSNNTCGGMEYCWPQ